MLSNTRVKIEALAGEDARDFHHAVGMVGYVDQYGLRESAHGYLSGGIDMDKLGYMYFRYVKVISLEVPKDNIILGYN
jgi:hypothetical protein